MKSTVIASTKLLIVPFLGISAMFLTVRPGFAQTICAMQPPVAVSNWTAVVQNNEFGSTDQECISVNGSSFTVTQSAIFKPTSGGPGAYPSIYAGCHWGKCSDQSANQMPVQATNLSSATSSWSTSQPGTGAYNVAYDLWFNTAPQVAAGTAGQPDAAELMIWLTGLNVQPNGSIAFPNVNIGGAIYDIWFKPRPQVCSVPPAPKVCWNYIAYVLKSGNASISSTATNNLDLKAIIQDAISRGYIDPSWYLIDVEAGFELWQGGTSLATNSFSVSVSNTLANAALNIWWPTDGAVLSGIQPFKARLENIPLSAYNMYWNVDGGQPNLMSDNSVGGDHKEFSVDMSGWTWRDNGTNYGPYTVTFVAKDLSGTTIQQKTITIFRSKP